MHHIDIRVEKNIFDHNNEIAHQNATRLKEHGIRAIDLLGAIGSGKTALIEQLVPLLIEMGHHPGAIAGDVFGEEDYLRM